MKFNPTKHKNVIFDLGGVIVNINYSLTKEAFRKLGIKNFDVLFSQTNQTNLFDNYEKGLISSAIFLEKLKQYLPENISYDEIIIAWNSMLLNLPLEQIGVINKVSAKYRTFLLSNTNEIHIQCFENYVSEELGIDNFFQLFEKSYLSFQIGMRKPDTEIFEFVLSENKLVGKETFFIDDSKQHIEKALALGIDAYWLDISKESIVDVFATI